MAGLTKLGYRFTLLGGTAVLLVAAVAALSMSWITSTTRKIVEAQEEARREFIAMQAIASAHVHYKKQVQEWKNMLIRSADPQLFRYHKNLFDHEAVQVSHMLLMTADSLRALGADPQNVISLQSAQNDLVARYRSALDRHDLGTRDGAKEIDRMVRGIDRTTGDQFDRVVQDIDSRARLRVDELVLRTRSDAKSAFRLFLVAGAAGVGIAVTLSLWIVYELLALVRSVPVRKG
jgi:methyl-accepting chemotaxis protein